MAARAYSFTVSLEEVAPTADPMWRSAPKALKREAMEQLLVFVLEAKDAELAAGLDRYGRPMTELAWRTRQNRRSVTGPADPLAPPLTPAHSRSRTRSLLTGRISKNVVICWWKYDAHSGGSWGRILAYHRAGRGRLPSRDVIGISPQSLSQVRFRMQNWWLARRFGRVVLQKPQPAPPPPGRTLVRPVPAYRPQTPILAVPGQRRVSQLEINNNVYTFHSGTAASVQRMIANQTFTGFRKLAPAGGP